jgi:hypothetical protein
MDSQTNTESASTQKNPFEMLQNLKMSAPVSKKSGKFTKKYAEKNKYNAIKEKVEFWANKHGRHRALYIMFEQGIITKSKLNKAIEHIS